MGVQIMEKPTIIERCCIADLNHWLRSDENWTSFVKCMVCGKLWEIE